MHSFYVVYDTINVNFSTGDVVLADRGFTCNEKAIHIMLIMVYNMRMVQNIHNFDKDSIICYECLQKLVSIKVSANRCPPDKK